MTTNSGTLQAQFFYIAGQNVSLKMKIPKPDNVSESLSNLRAIFAVDKSGSMSGQPISDARGALLSLIKKFQQFDVPVSVYAFNSSFKFYTS